MTASDLVSPDLSMCEARRKGPTSCREGVVMLPSWFPRIRLVRQVSQHSAPSQSLTYVVSWYFVSCFCADFSLGDVWVPVLELHLIFGLYLLGSQAGFLLFPAGIFASHLTILSTPDYPSRTGAPHIAVLSPSRRFACKHPVAPSSPSRRPIRLQRTVCSPAVA